MKTYTENEINAIVDKAYRKGFEDGREPRDRIPSPVPPTLHELEIYHPRASSLDTLLPP